MSADAKVGFVREPNGRGTIGLLWSCLFTWLLCSWVLFHVNIPARNDSKQRVICRRIYFLVIGIIFPELLAGITLTQCRDAYLVVLQIRELHSRVYLPLPRLVQKDMEHIQSLRELPLTHWSLTHGFSCVMGGFGIIPSEGSSKKIPVNAQQPDSFTENGHVRLPIIPSKEQNGSRNGAGRI